MRETENQENYEMTSQQLVTRRSKLLTASLVSILVLSTLWQRQSADAQVTEVTGSAFGFFTSVGLFGGAPTDIGPLPTVELPAGGSASPITASASNESAVYGPAVFIEAESIEVSTQGTTGDDGSVASSATVVFPQPQEDQVDPFNADTIESQCTADASGASGTVTLTNPSLVTKTDDTEGDPVDTIPIPEKPEPNSTFGGTIDNVGDSFRVVFNEQIEENGVLTVNAVHFFFGQNEAGEEVESIAKGEAIYGQTVCGVNASGSGSGTATTTTAAPGSGSGATTTTTASGGGAGATTTTARSGGSNAPASGPASTTPAQPRLTG